MNMFLFKTIHSNSISAENALIDATTANAFCAPVGFDFTPYRGKQIEIWSGSTLWARAWVSGTAPGGESLDSELSSDPGFDVSVWTLNGWNLSGSKASAVDRTTNLFITTPSLPAYCLIKMSLSIDTVISGTVANRIGGLVTGTARNSPGSYSDYLTVDGTTRSVAFSGTSFTGSMTDNSAKRVTDPASTGALLLSTKGGSRGWVYKHASFNPNAAVTLRILARRIASGNGGYYK